MQVTDVVIECRSCGFIASEYMFLAINNGDQLLCPECGDGCNLWDYEED